MNNLELCLFRPFLESRVVELGREEVDDCNAAAAWKTSDSPPQLITKNDWPNSTAAAVVCTHSVYKSVKPRRPQYLLLSDMAHSGALDQRRPSASLRTRRASTVYEEREGGEAAPAVPSIPSNHLAPHYNNAGPSHGGPPPVRPSPRHAKSSDSDVRAGGRNRAGTSNSGHSGNINPDNSKVGAYLLNKRQSVSFGKAMAGQQRGMVHDGSGGPPVPALPGQRHEGRPAHVSMRRNVEASAGEEMIARGPRGPAGETLTDLLKEDFDADACERQRTVLKPRDPY